MAFIPTPRRALSYGLDDEPSLDERLDDPVTEAVMVRDGVTRDEITDIFVLVRTAFATPDE